MFLQTLVSDSENSTSTNDTMTSWPTHLDSEHGVTEGLVVPVDQSLLLACCTGPHAASVAFTPGLFGQSVPKHGLFFCSHTRDHQNPPQFTVGPQQPIIMVIEYSVGYSDV